MAQAQDYTPFEIEIDGLDQVTPWDGQSRPLLPVGTYRFEIVNVTNEGKFLAVEFKVVEGANIDGRAWNNYMLTTKPGKQRLAQLMLACGANMTRFNSDEILGQKIYADVIHQPGKAAVDSMGQPLEAKIFANVQNERAKLSDGEVLGAADDASSSGGENVAGGEGDPEPPPITKSQPNMQPDAQSSGQATAQDQTASSGGGANGASRTRSRRA